MCSVDCARFRHDWRPLDRCFRVCVIFIPEMSKNQWFWSTLPIFLWHSNVANFSKFSLRRQLSPNITSTSGIRIKSGFLSGKGVCIYFMGLAEEVRFGVAHLGTSVQHSQWLQVFLVLFGKAWSNSAWIGVGVVLWECIVFCLGACNEWGAYKLYGFVERCRFYFAGNDLLGSSLHTMPRLRL